MPEVRRLWAESQFVKTNCCDQVDFCPFRGPDAPFALSELTTKLEAGTYGRHQPGQGRRGALKMLALVIGGNVSVPTGAKQEQQ